MNINVHVPVTINSIEYYKQLCANHLEWSSGKRSITFIAYCLGNEVDKALAEHELTLDTVVLPGCRGPDAHASSVRAIIARTNKLDITVIADSDTFLLARNWDDAIVDFIKNGVGVVGTAFYPSATTDPQPYAGKPNTNWLALSPKFSWRKLGVTPFVGHNTNVDTESKSQLWNIPIGSQLVRNVAWQIPEYLHSNKIPFECLFLKSNDKFEEYVLPNGTSFVARMLASSKYVSKDLQSTSDAFYSACTDFVCMTT